MLGQGSIYTLASAAPILTAVFVTPLLTRTLNLAEYDHVAVGLVVINFTLSLLAMGLPNAITRHALTEASGPAGARGLVRNGGAIAVAIGVVAAVVAGSILAVTGPAPWPGLLPVAILAGAVGSTVAMVQAYALSREAAWYFVAMALGQSLGAPLVGLISALVLGRTALVYVVGMFVTYVIVAAAGFLRLRLDGPATASRVETRAAFGVALPFIPHQLAVGFATGAMVLVATLTLPPGAAAQTQVSLLLVSAPLAIISSLSYAWTPIILSAPAGERKAHMEETASAVAWLAALGGGALAFLAPWFLRFLANGRDFRTDLMEPVVAAGSAAATFAAAFLSHVQFILAKGRTRRLAVSSPAALVIGVGIGAVLAPFIGLTAMGVGVTATYAVLYILTRRVAARIETERWNEAVLAAPLVTSVLCAAAATQLPAHGLGAIIRLTAAGLLLALAVGRFLRTLRRGGHETPGTGLKIVVLTPAFVPAHKAGGPVPGILGVLDTVRTEDVEVFTSDRDLNESTPYPPPYVGRAAVAGVPVHYLPPFTNPLNCRGWIRLLGHVRRADVVYFNSFNSKGFTVLPWITLALGFRGRVAISPRGELAGSALRLGRSSQKRLWIDMFRRFRWYAGVGRSVNVVWVASSERERQDILRAFPLALVAVSPERLRPVDGASAPPVHRRDPGEPFGLISVGRIAPVKGTLELVRALQHVTSPCRLTLIGLEENPQYAAEVHEAIAALPDHVRVELVGAVGPDDVIARAGRADLAVFLTHGENFGHAVGEALRAGCPVLVSDQTPWTASVGEDAGRVIAIEDCREPLRVAKAIDELAGLDEPSWARMSRAARAAGERGIVLPGSRTLLEAIELLDPSSSVAQRKPSPSAPSVPPATSRPGID